MASASNNLISPIREKLTSANYLLWKAQIEPLLWSQDLYGYIDGSKPIPEKFQAGATTDAPSTPNPEYLKWFKEDQKVKMILNSSLSVSVLPQVIGCPTAREVWDRLFKAYGTGSRAQMLSLKQDFGVLTKGSKSIDAYLLRAKNIVDQLAMLGQPVSNDDIVQKVLFGLDETYRPFARNIEVRGEAISLAKLYGLLKIEEMNLRHVTAAQPTSLVPSVYSQLKAEEGAAVGTIIGEALVVTVEEIVACTMVLLTPMGSRPNKAQPSILGSHENPIQAVGTFRFKRRIFSALTVLVMVTWLAIAVPPVVPAQPGPRSHGPITPLHPKAQDLRGFLTRALPTTLHRTCRIFNFTQNIMALKK